MTTFYPTQPTPQFLKKYSRNVYNRVHHNLQHDSNQANGVDEASLALQVRRHSNLLFNQFIDRFESKKIPV